MRATVIVFAVITGAWGTVWAQQKTVWDGVFTAEQATRGEARYVEMCAVCHGKDLKGDAAPSLLIDDEFGSHWNELDLGQLFDFIKGTMPKNDPGSLKPEQTADLLAFLLQRGEVPPGQSALPAKSEDLKAIKFLSKNLAH